MMKPFHRSLMAGASTLVLVLALEASPAYADDFTVDTATVFQNGGNTLNGDDNLTITNTGSITPAAGVDAVNASGDNNTISNDGTISTAGDFAYGISANGNSTIVNSGSISTTGDDAEGIFVFNNNIITNSGSISTTRDGAEGISAFENNTITNSNSGLISTDGEDAHGIKATDGNTIANSGEISTTDSGAIGIDADNNNIITNSGEISTDGEDGLGILANNNNIITNSGEISTDGEDAFGIHAFDNNIITNSGSISTDGEDAFGIRANNNNIITNSGSISTTDSDSDGIRADNNNRITNSGSISTMGNNTYGIYADDNNIITNSGSISTMGNLTLGIFAGDDNIISNSGSISTTGDDAHGIFVDADNIITNSGLISATGAGADAIRLGDSTNTLILNPGSVLIGGLYFVESNNTLNVGNGLSIANTFTNNLPGTINSNGAPVAVNGMQVAVVDPTGIAMQDEVITDLTNNISNSVFNALKSARSGAGSGPSGSEQPLFLSGSGSASGSAETATRYWGKVFGSRRQQEGQSPTVDAEHWVVGTVSGVDAPISANTRAGGFLGGSTGEVEVAFDSQETEIDSFFGGFYAGTRMGVVTLDVMVTGGWTEHERERKVANNLVATGIQTARADFNGRFIAPEVAVSVDTGLFVPSAKVRYTAFHLDGFTETGALGNFSVDDRDLHILQGRLQIAMPIISSGEDSSYTKFEPYVGIEGRSIVSGESVDAILLGQSISFNPGGDDDVFSVYAGFNGSARVASNVELFVNAEANFEDDDTYRFGGNVGAKVTF